MGDNVASKPHAKDAWDEAVYISVIPDFKGAPETMFHAAAGWGHPDPAWQREHGGWEPDREALSGAGRPVHLSHWSYWVPKAEIKREARALRARRVVRYAFYAALYPVAITAIIVVALTFVFFPAAFVALFVGAPIALAGSIVLFVMMSLILTSMDFLYLAALRRGKRKVALFHWTFTPVLVLAIVLSLAVSILVYWIVARVSDSVGLGAFSAGAAMLSLLATIPLLVIYPIRELHLRES